MAAALTAALCWTLASQLWRRLPTSLSASELNLLKNLLALAMLAPLLLGQATSPGWEGSGLLPAMLLAASGVLGIALGDSLYFAALRRLGTRRTLTVEAGAPALTATGATLLLGEVAGPWLWGGIALISLALLLVAGQAAPGQERQRNSPWPGLALALAALFCGSAGALLARTALAGGTIQPLAAASLRLAAASLVMLPVLPALLARRHGARQGPAPSSRRWQLVLLATLLGTTAGIALQQLALIRLPAALAVALLATAPVMAVLLAPLEGDRPYWRGWLAALAALAGVVLAVGG